MTTNHRRDAGLLILRLGIGGTLFAHGAQKLFGWFGGGGVEGTAGAMEKMGFRPGKPSALAAGASEVVGGGLLALGFATPAAGSVVAGNMVAAASVHGPNGFFAQQGGFEYPALLGLSTAALSLTGPGSWSLDALTGHKLNKWWMAAGGLAASTALSALVVRQRNKALAAPPESPDAPVVETPNPA